jgi:catechol 2,3-dioxygenase-like lactoylglutathione lyase family enzyme
MKSCLTLYTNQFKAMLDFYRDRLGFSVLEHSDQAGGDGVLFELPGMLLEVIDNDHKASPELLGASLDRIHITVAISDIEAARDFLDIETPIPNITQQGDLMFQLRDPDGLPINFIQKKDCSAVMGEVGIKQEHSSRSNQ